MECFADGINPTFPFSHLIPFHIVLKRYFNLFDRLDIERREYEKKVLAHYELTTLWHVIASCNHSRYTAKQV